MKVLVPKRRDDPFDYPQDIERIQEAFRKSGFLISEATAEFAWLEYSDSMAAGWLCLPKFDGEIVASALPYLRYDPEGEEK